MLKLSLLLCFTLNVLVDSFPFDESLIEGHVNGINKIDITQAPHQAAVFFYNYYSCSGIIVSPSHIVTTGTCVLDSFTEHLHVRTGSTFNKKGGVVSKVKSVHLHPKWDDGTADYDVAVIELATPLKFDNKTIKAIKFSSKEPAVGTNVTVAGWGFYENDSDEDNRLKSVTINIRTRTECEAASERYNVPFTETMMCGSVDREMGFAGDMGSAVVYKGEALGIANLDFSEEALQAPRVFINYAHPEIAKFIKDVAKV